MSVLGEIGDNAVITMGAVITSAVAGEGTMIDMGAVLAVKISW